MRVVALSALASLAISACFDGSLPEGAQVLCAADAACPAPSLCNLTTHLCNDDVAPPQVVAFSLVNPPADVTYADAAGFGDVVVSLTADEPLATMSLAIGALTTSCAPESPQQCTVTIPPGSTLDSGAVDVVATIADRAGNASDASLAIVVDTAAPAIVADSVELDVTTGGVVTTAATTSSVITVSFVSDEDLGAPPLAFLDADGVDVALDVVDIAGRRASFRYDDALVLAPGTYPLRAALVDRFGHASSVALADVLMVEDGELCPRPEGLTCVDFDGDGAFAASSCDAGSDLDDRDPTVFPGARDIPGDGRDNDGVAGDAIVDELTGMFFDCDNGDDATGDGSRAAPYRTLQAGLDPELSTVAFLATCNGAYLAPAFDAVNPDEIAGLVGGLDSTTWTRTGARSVVRGDMQVLGFVDSIEGADTLLVFDGVVVRSLLSSLDTFNTVRISSSSLGLLNANGDTRVVDSTIASVLSFEAVTLHRVHVLDGVTLSGDASLTATSSVLQSAAGPAVVSLASLSVSLFHTTLLGLDAAQEPVLSAQATPEVRLIGCSVVSANSFPALDVELGVITLVDTNIFSAGPPLRVGFDVIAASDIDTCGDAGGGCVRTERNTTLDPQSGVDFRLPSTSPLRAADVLAIAEGAPTTVVSDFDGDCRYADGSADIGADEVTP